MKKILVGALFLASFNAFAISFNISLDCGYFGGSCTTVEQQLKTQAEEDLPDVSLAEYADGISTAVGAASQDNSDHSDKFSLFAFKYSPIGIGFVGDQSDSDNPEKLKGFGLQGNMQIGLNLDLLPIDKIGPVELKKLDVFASFFSLTNKTTEKDTSTDAEVSSYGLFARYHLIEGIDLIPGYMAEWGGVFVHTGFRSSTMKLKLTSKLAEQTVSSGGFSAQFSNAVANFTMDSNVSHIPVEISTYVRFLYIFTLYGGVGADFNMGSTDVDFTMSGDVYESGTDRGDVSADDKNNGKPDSLTARAFAGFQFNLPFVRAYLQLQKYIGAEAGAVSLGAKVLF